MVVVGMGRCRCRRKVDVGLVLVEKCRDLLGDHLAEEGWE